MFIKSFSIKCAVSLLVKKATKAATTLSGKNEFEDVSLSDIDRMNANVFLNSKSTIPHFYSSAVCNLNNVLANCREWAKDGMYLQYSNFKNCKAKKELLYWYLFC